MTNAKKEFADLLKDARERRGMTQGRLSKISKVSTRTIVALEVGNLDTNRVRYDVVVRLSLTLHEDLEKWLAVWGYEVDPEKVNQCRRQIDMPPGPDVHPPELEPVGRFPLLLKEEGELRTRPKEDEHPWEVWIVESKEPVESVHVEAAKVVKANVKAGINYRFFYPVSSDGNQLPERYWGNPLKAINTIRQTVARESGDEIAKRIHVHKVEIHDFPLFLFNSSTVIFTCEGVLEFNQSCYRVININEPESAWYYTWEPRAARELIKFLRTKIK